MTITAEELRKFSSDSTPLPGDMRSAYQIALDLIQELEGHLKCPVCFGDSKSITNICICEGSGSVHVAYSNAVVRICKLEKESEDYRILKRIMKDLVK